MNHNSTTSEKPINWKEILIFYIIAVGVSAPFRLNLITLSEILPLPYGFNIFYRVLRGIGPAMGFLVIYYIFHSKVEKKLSFWGVNKIYSLIAAIILPIGLGIVGVNNTEDLNTHYYGFLTGVFLLCYAMGEELGWRAYLQEALSPMKLMYRVVAIAILWYIWHLNFLLPDFNLKNHLVFFAFLLLGSWGLLKISESTHSLLFVVAVHLAFNILSDVRMDGNSKVFVVLAAAGVWTILMLRLKKEKSNKSNTISTE